MCSVIWCGKALHFLEHETFALMCINFSSISLYRHTYTPIQFLFIIIIIIIIIHVLFLACLSISLGWGHQNTQSGSWTQTASSRLATGERQKINCYAAHLQDLFKILRNFSSDIQFCMPIAPDGQFEKWYPLFSCALLYTTVKTNVSQLRLGSSNLDQLTGKYSQNLYNLIGSGHWLGAVGVLSKGWRWPVCIVVCTFIAEDSESDSL